jgi:hypothetical protein
LQRRLSTSHPFGGHCRRLPQDQHGFLRYQEAGEAMADLLCIPPLPQGKNPWDMRVARPPAGRPPDGGYVLGRIDEYRSVD